MVRAEPGRLDDLVRLLARQGVAPGRRIALIDAVTADLPAGTADDLRETGLVASVTPNAEVRLLGTGYDPASDVNSLFTSQRATGVRSVWAQGYTGAGIDIALVDSGVGSVAGLDGPGQVVTGPDLTDEADDPGVRSRDTFGHGTHMAGIIAGRDDGATAGDASDSSHFQGVAPRARLVSVKVADAEGSADVAQVIAGLDWVVRHADDPGLNIRVLNLSFGTDSTQDYVLDPLAYAVERAWHAGIVVVVSAGNNGSGGMTNPATDPYVIAVGAEDTLGTPSVADDVVPPFSSQGLGQRRPDLVAPGVHVQSLRVPGSTIDLESAATGIIDERFFRGSGTSQAAAFVSGAAALILQAHPQYTPNQVKQVLRSSAQRLPHADDAAQGEGAVQVGAALHATPQPSAQRWPRATGRGSLARSRGTTERFDGMPRRARSTLESSKDLATQDRSWSRKPTQRGSRSRTSAEGATWSGKSWAGNSWSGSSWAGSSWAGSWWSGATWSGGSWF